MQIQWKEFGLWLAFLIFCMGAGFLHGSLPEIQFRFFFQNPEKVQIVTYDKSLLPHDLIAAVEKKDNLEISILETTSWEDLRVRVVLNQGPHLLLIPQSWVSKLQREGRLRNINPLKTKLAENVSEQFMFNTSEKIYFSPIFWTLTRFVTSIESEFKSFNDALKSPRLQKIELFKNQEAFEKRLQNSEWQSLKSKNKVAISEEIIPELQRIEKNYIYEWPQQYLTKSKKVLGLKDSPNSQLQVYGFSVPNNTPSRQLSMDVIEEFTTKPYLMQHYKKMQIGIALKKIETNSTEALQRPSSLKDVNLNNVYFDDQPDF
jgi:hypothetical protein